MENEKFEGWCILELMGHRRLAGWVSEQEFAGSAFVRLDVYEHAPEPGGMVAGGIHEPAEPDKAIVTQFYSPAAVYCITPTTEDIARKLGAKSKPEPVSRFELEPPRRHPHERQYDAMHRDDDEDML